LRDGTVEYLLWPQGLEGGPPAAAHAVLANVAEMRLSALREDGAWLPVWPAGQPLPRAVAVELALVSGERVTRLFPLK
jgi:type II secretion system (T2SS) protein J